MSGGEEPQAVRVMAATSYKALGRSDGVRVQRSGHRLVHGGFSDCLPTGAASVACVDVFVRTRMRELAGSARERVRREHRLADPVELGAPFDVLVADLGYRPCGARLTPVFAIR